MKLPQTFRMNKDLDEKTKQLEQEAYILRKDYEIPEGSSDLEKVLKKFNTCDKYSTMDSWCGDCQEIHNAVYDMVEDKKYKVYKDTKRFIHWIKDDPYDPYSAYLFSRRSLKRYKDVNRYSFAHINYGNLEKVCNDIEKVLTDREYAVDSSKTETHVIYASFCAIPLGASLGFFGFNTFFGSSILALSEGVFFTAMGSAAMISLAGLISINKISDYVRTKYFKKYTKGLDNLKNLSYNVIVEDKKAVEAAFK
ncbi:MAG: hypothetical protein KKA79_02500 [Nanoarchaeota archaeon]|nr:hypothetical protein [Nanoarchaeota archaeon]